MLNGNRTGSDWQSLARLDDLGQYLTDSIRDLVLHQKIDKDAVAVAFKKTFDLLYADYAEDAFRKNVNDKFRGPFSIALYEALAIGLGAKLCVTGNYSGSIADARAKIVSNSEFDTSSGSGVRGTTRMPKMIEIGKAAF